MTITQVTVASSPAELMELFAQLAAVGDVDALLALYEADAVLQPEFGVVFRGHEQIRPALTELLAMKPQITYTSAADVVICGNMALVSNFWTMQATAPDGTKVTDGGTSADVVRRQTDGSWLVLIDQPRGIPTPA